jgi:hypothetical protein
MASWLDAITKRILAKLPKRPKEFYPQVLFNFEHLREAIHIIEEAVVRTRADSKTESDARLAAAMKNPFHSFIDDPVFAPMAVEWWKTEITLPAILRRSLLIAIYSHVEHVLRQWCDGLHKEWELTRDFTTFKRAVPGPTKPAPTLYLLYLRDEAGLALDDFEGWKEWGVLDAYRVARNCLAHDGGIVDRTPDRQKIESLPYIEVDTSGLLSRSPMIHLMPGACENAVGAANEFFERVVDIYRQHSRVVEAGGPE